MCKNLYSYGHNTDKLMFGGAKGVHVGFPLFR